MSLKNTSNGSLQIVCSSNRSPVLESGTLYKSLSLSSSHVNDRLSSGKDGQDEKGSDHAPFLDSGMVSRPCRKPVRMVRPVSALSPATSFIQISRLQGELVRKRKECEDLKQQNKYLTSEIHMERIMMRTESELTMRNLRNLNQELQAQVKELKQKLHACQQRVSLCTRAAGDADVARCEAERSRAQAEARAKDSEVEKDLALAEKGKLTEELQHLKTRLNDVQQLLNQGEKNYFECKLKLDKISVERQVLLEENRDLEHERNELRHKLKELTEQNVKLKEKEVSSRRRALSAEEASEQAVKARLEAEREKRLLEHERQERMAEGLVWRERHQALADVLKAQEELYSQRQNKGCQVNIKSYFLCVTENDQKIKILKNQDGTPRHLMEGEPVYFSTPDTVAEEPGRNQDRLLYRITAPSSSSTRGSSPVHFSELLPQGVPEMGSARRTTKVVEYFWLPAED
nr:PREDICTED: spindle pole body component 110-like [Lepisosteus oculatus]